MALRHRADALTHHSLRRDFKPVQLSLVGLLSLITMGWDRGNDMSNENGSANSASEFLAGLAERLRAHDGVDGDLAGILETHILITAPDAKAVAKPKDAILALASKRAPASTNERDAADHIDGQAEAWGRALEQGSGHAVLPVPSAGPLFRRRYRGASSGG